MLPNGLLSVPGPEIAAPPTACARARTWLPVATGAIWALILVGPSLNSLLLFFWLILFIANLVSIFFFLDSAWAGLLNQVYTRASTRCTPLHYEDQDREMGARSGLYCLSVDRLQCSPHVTMLKGLDYRISRVFFSVLRHQSLKIWPNWMGKTPNLWLIT